MDRSIRVKVFTESKREGIKKISDDKFEVSVKEKAENNMANKRVLEVLSDYLKSKRLKIISGHRRSNKIISLIDN